MNQRYVTAAVGLIALVSSVGLAQRSAPAPISSAGAPMIASAQIVASAQALLATLDDTGRAKVLFPFDGPQKARWSNFPSGIFQRQGLRLGDLTPPQRAAVMSLLATAFSRDGYRKVTEIMRGDEVLRTTEGGRGPVGGPGPPDGRDAGGRGGRGRGGPGGGGLIFGENEYYLAFVGTPSATAPWMLQFGGHHLAVNLTIAGSRASMTPSLPAAQPATYTIEGRAIRPLGNEHDKAFALVNALDAPQRGQAILAYRVADLVLGPGQDGRTIQPEGIKASALTGPQRTMLLDIVREWAGIMHEAYAEPRMAEIQAGLPQTYFAWSGPTTNGSAAYFRIQGPTVLIEYAPQGDVDHIHTIYRDPTNDYGAQFTR
jgi:hypothetical protein